MCVNIFTKSSIVQVKVGYDKEMEQSDRNFHSNNRDGKN